MFTYLNLGAAVLTFARLAHAQDNNASLPEQAVMIDLLQTNVLGLDYAFRNDSFTDFLNPTNTTPPFFQVFDDEFLDVLGSNASIRVVSSDPSWAFAHEAPVWVPSTNEVFFAANGGGALGRSNISTNSIVSKISMDEVYAAIDASNSSTAPLNVTHTSLNLSDSIQMANGGTGTYYGDVLLITSGRGEYPPAIARMNPRVPYNVTVLLDNFLGRQFDSLNDLKVRGASGDIFFTDESYGWLLHYRPVPAIPRQVYRFDPRTGSVRAVADGIMQPNGIAFSGDGKTVYVSDTGAAEGFMGNNGTAPATIYAYDVDERTEAWTNRRVFAYADAGIPDGLALDTRGNVYAGCADGVHVWNTAGKLVGKFFVGSTSANMAFTDRGLVLMGETAVYFVELAARGVELSYPPST